MSDKAKPLQRLQDGSWLVIGIKTRKDNMGKFLSKDGLHINKESIGTGGGTAVTPDEIDEIRGIINSGQENRKYNEFKK